MGQMDKEVFVCLDCETTGLDARKDRIIEVAAVRFTMTEVLEEFQALVDPECVIPESSIAIHHITQEMVANKPTMKEILPDLLKIFGSHIVVGHGITFDMEIVAHAAERAGIPCKLMENRFLDTLRMARLYGRSPVNSLDFLRRHFNIEAEGAHRAMGDVTVNVAVFRQLAKDYKTIEQLFEALSRPILFKYMPLGKHKGRLLKDIPLQFLLWAVRQAYDEDLLFTLRSEIKRRKQGNLFSQAINPFADL